MEFTIFSLAVLTLIVSTIYYFLVFPAFVSPLSKIPSAHFTSSFSILWLKWIRYTGRENRTVYHLHKVKGPIIRLAPNELSLNCFDGGLRQIYLNGFPKSDFYIKGFMNYNTGPMFAMTNNAQHGARKRMLSNVFSKSYVLASPTAREVNKVVLFDRFLTLIQDHAARDEPLEMVDLNYAYSMDSFVNWQYGLSCGSNLIENKEERKMYLDGFFNRELYGFEAVEISGITSLLEKFGIRLIPKFVDEGTKNIEDWNIAMCDKAEELLRTKTELTDAEYPVVFAQALKTMGKPPADEKPDHSEKYYNRNEIACEMFSDNSAAHETSGNTLTYVYYELSRRPEMQAKLREELLTLDPPLYLPESETTPLQVPAAKEVLELPLLEAIIMETLRLYPTVPGPQPRTTPKPANSLGGVNQIPAGVTVQCSAYSIHRNSDVFPDPEAWKPERWLDATPQQLNDMRRWFWAFGSGASMCIGSNFAWYSMKHVVAGIYTNFTTTIHKHGDMELLDSYLAGAKGNSLVLKFHRI